MVGQKYNKMNNHSENFGGNETEMNLFIAFHKVKCSVNQSNVTNK